MLRALCTACAQETLVPVMYGFGKQCRVISEVSTDQLLKVMALHGDNADLRELLRDPEADVALKRALGGG